MNRILGSVLCLSLLVGGCQKSEPPPPVRPARAMELKEEEVVRLHSFPGRTRAVHRVNLSFRVSGPLIERTSKVGDEVKKGALLARIDPRDFEVKLDNAEGKLEQAKAQLRFAESDYQRAQNIYKKDPGAISESFLDQKKEEVGQLLGEVKSLAASVEAAEDELSYAYLLSPYDGMVVATYVQNFEYVKAKQPILRLLNNSQVEMVIDVPESLISEIPNVQEINVEFDAFPGRKFPAEVKEIGTEASVTTRTYPVTLIVDQPEDATILAGMAGQAVLISKQAPGFSEEGFLLPTTAIFTDNARDKTFVWIINPETQEVSVREVETGKLTAQGILVTKGLTEEEWVVTAGVYSLHEGQKVVILPVKLGPKGEQIEIDGAS